MAVSNQLNPIFDEANLKKPIISADAEGATRTLHPSESGALVVLDRLAGIVITLPAPNARQGIYYDFAIPTQLGSSTVQIITDSGSVYITGGILNIDTDSADADDWMTCGSSAVSINFNGSTTGAQAGTNFRLTSASASRWMVSGVVTASGTVIGPFRTTT